MQVLLVMNGHCQRCNNSLCVRARAIRALCHSPLEFAPPPNAVLMKPFITSSPLRNLPLLSPLVLPSSLLVPSSRLVDATPLFFSRFLPARLPPVKISTSLFFVEVVDVQPQSYRTSKPQKLALITFSSSCSGSS